MSHSVAVKQPGLRRQVCALLDRLPLRLTAGLVVEQVAELRDRYGPVHAGTFLRERRIALNCTRAELPRILVHELFHFGWVRLGNARRREYERLLEAEIRSRAKGELGWSAEWRKLDMKPDDLPLRTRRWREYCCESFCDTAAWLYSGVAAHDEFTLAGRFCRLRRQWFGESVGRQGISI